MAKAGMNRPVVRGRGGATVLMAAVAGTIALSSSRSSWSFCSSPSSKIGGTAAPPRSVSKVQVRFMGMDKNNDGKISPEEFRDGMGTAIEKGNFNIGDFYGAVGLTEDEISTVFTVVGEDGRARLWTAMQQDLDMGTVKKGFPYFNSELNSVLPGIPRFNSGFFDLNKDKTCPLSEGEFQEGIDMVTERAKIDDAEFFKRINSNFADMYKLFNLMDDLERVQIWQAVVRDIDKGNSKDFPFFKDELRIKTQAQKKKFSETTALELLVKNLLG